MEKLFDVICIGDGVLDTFLSVGSSDYVRFDASSEKLILHAGSKILVDTTEFTLGGNASNVAAGLARLGLQAALVAELGDDEFGQKIHKGLLQEGVNLDFVKVTPAAQSTFSVGISIGGERTLFVHHVQREHQLPLEGLHGEWVYLTSMGEKWRDMYTKVLEYITHTGAKLAFNPGSAQMHAGYESFKDIVSACEILFVNRDEAEELLYGKLRSQEEKETAESLLFRLQRMGPKMVVLTDGKDGSYVLSEDNQVSQQGIVKEKAYIGRTGAGDAYASGFLGAILCGKDVPTAMQWGTHNSAAVLEHIGAQVGLLTKEQMQSRIEEQKVEVVEEAERIQDIMK